MALIGNITDSHEQLTSWRRDLHAHPQTAFEETYAAEFIAARLESFGVAVHRGLAKTGVVGTLEGSGSATGKLSAIGLRADIDALDIEEQNDFSHRSKNPGKMHACGHDGHTTMLLGAAQYLAATRKFSGRVQFIFQPAEENEGGGRVMVEEGLFEQFPVDAVFGMHNWPGLPVGEFAVAAGPLMAAFDVFEITIRGAGSHAAMPHLGIDPIVISAQVVQAMQTIASRKTNPLEQVVVSITQIHGGDTWNVIPVEVKLRGTVRTFRDAIQDETEATIKQMVAGIASANGGQGEVSYERRYPATVNSERETRWSAEVAEDLVGTKNVLTDPTPCMGSEDFSFMLQERPGCFVWIGNGSSENGRVVHSPHYDFNDEIIPIGASYWSRLVETLLPV